MTVIDAQPDPQSATRLRSHEQDMRDLQRAVTLLEAPSLVMKISNLVGAPLESAMKRLPAGTKEKVQGIVHAALHKAADTALRSLRPTDAPKASSNLLHKVMAAGSGAVGGAFGLAALAVELPVTTTLMLRSIADIARSEGFDLQDQETRALCIQVFALGGPSSQDDATETGYYAVRSAMAEAMNALAREMTTKAARQAGAHTGRLAAQQASTWMSRLIDVVAARMGIVVTEKTAAQAVPIVGGVAGATINTLFMDYYQNAARGHFIVKRLERKYGFEVVRDAYQGLRAPALPQG